MYKKTKIENYRGITEIQINDFQQINLFVGENNCGKTTILEALFLLAGGVNPILPFNVNRFRNVKKVDEIFWTMLFNKYNPENEINIKAEMDSSFPVRQLIIKPNSKNYFESLKNLKQNSNEEESPIDINDMQDSNTGVQKKVNGLVLELILSGNEMKDSEKVVSEIFRFAGEISGTPVERQDLILKARFLNRSTILGKDVAERFDELQTHKKINHVVSQLTKIEPTLKELKLGNEKVIHADIGLEKLIPVNALGDGFNRLLSLILAAYNNQNGMLFIDEIENGLHFSSLEILWKTLLETSKNFNVQVFASTHSWEAVKALSKVHQEKYVDQDNIRLYRIEKKDDRFKSVVLNSEKIKIAIEKEWEIR